MSEKAYISLPKWPFLVGDLVLVLLACFIVISSPKPMSGIGIFASTLSVLLGMLVYVTPYIIEHLTQQQRIKLKQAKAEETLLKAVELASDLLNRTESIQAELMKGVLGVRQVPAKLEEVTEELVELLESDTLASSVTELSDLLNRIESSKEFKGATSSDALSKSEINEILETLSPVKASQLTDASESIRLSIEDLRNEVLNKFESVTTQRHEHALETTADPEKAPDSINETSSDEQEMETDQQIEEPVLESEDSTFDEEENHNDDPNEESSSETEFNDSDQELEEDTDFETQETEMLIEEETTRMVDDEIAIRHNEDGATRLIVGAFIGISNKLFIRGEGPGLDWDKGIPMELVGIGKWEWKTYDANTAVQCKVLINDEQWTDSENITIEPNTTLETTASF